MTTEYSKYLDNNIIGRRHIELEDPLVSFEECRNNHSLVCSRVKNYPSIYSTENPPPIRESTTYVNDGKIVKDSKDGHPYISHSSKGKGISRSYDCLCGETINVEERYVQKWDGGELIQLGQKGTPPILKSPEGTFSLYSTLEEVIMAQGAPDSQKKTGSNNDGFDWYARQQVMSGDSKLLSFKLFDAGDRGVYHEGDYYKGFWRTRLLQPDPLLSSGYPFLGLNGFTVLKYGASRVLFGSMPDCSCDECANGKYVIAWANAGNLKLADFRWRMESIEHLYKGLNYGMSIEQVLISQGNPTMIIPEYPPNSLLYQYVTCWNNLEQATLRFYYINFGYLKSDQLDKYEEFVFWPYEPSEIIFSPKIRLLTRIGESKTKQGIEWAKEHNRATVERIEQTVIGFTNGSSKNPLVLDATEAVEGRERIIQKENSLRWLDLLELQELFTSIKEEALRLQQEEALRLQQGNKAIIDALGRPIVGGGPTKSEMQKFLSSTVDSSTHDKGLGLELFSKKLLEAMGWEIEHSGKSGDGGVDLTGLKSDDLLTLKIVVQCKHQDSVAEDVVAQTFGKAQSENADRAYVITTGKFTENAKNFANKEPKIVLIDGDALNKLSTQYLDI